MEGNKVHYRQLMLFFYQKGKNATQTANKICAVKLLSGKDLEESGINHL